MSRHKAKTATQIKEDLEKQMEKRAQERAAQRDPANWGINMAASTLEANKDVEGQKIGDRVRARRSSWMDRLLSKSNGEYQAVLRLSNLTAIKRGENDRSSGNVSSGPRTLVSDRMLEAGDTIRELFSHMGFADQRLLTELICPTIIATNADEKWRIIVGVLTGEKDKTAQAATVRQAARNLAEAFVALDYASPKKRA